VLERKYLRKKIFVVLTFLKIKSPIHDVIISKKYKVI